MIDHNHAVVLFLCHVHKEALRFHERFYWHVQLGIVIHNYAKIVGRIKLEVITVIANEFAACYKGIIIACQVFPFRALPFLGLNEVLEYVPLTFWQ